MTKEEMINYLRNEINKAVKEFNSALEIYGDENDFTARCARKYIYLEEMLKDMGIKWEMELD